VGEGHPKRGKTNEKTRGQKKSKNGSGAPVARTETEGINVRNKTADQKRTFTDKVGQKKASRLPQAKRGHRIKGDLLEKPVSRRENNKNKTTKRGEKGGKREIRGFCPIEKKRDGMPGG